LEQPTLSNNNTTTRQRIIKYLARQAKAPQPPVQISKGIRLNQHTVRRELQELLKAGTIRKEQHAYFLANPPDKRAEKRMLRKLIGRLMDEYATRHDTSYFSELTDRKRRIEHCLRTIDKATVYNGTEEVKQLARAVFGREEHGGLVMYQATLPEWFTKLRELLSLDEGLTPTATEEFKRVRNEARKQAILTSLKTDPYLLGDSNQNRKGDVIV
jgi:predicted ArsR family transcriptional regulator